MGKLLDFPKRPKLALADEAPDTLSFATLYAMKRNALEEGDLELASEIDEEVRRMMDRSD